LFGIVPKIRFGGLGFDACDLPDLSVDVKDASGRFPNCLAFPRYAP